jgi:hypothetical protein
LKCPPLAAFQLPGDIGAADSMANFAVICGFNEDAIGRAANIFNIGFGDYSGTYVNDFSSSTTPQLTDNAWHHYAYTFNKVSNVMTLFVDSTNIALSLGTQASVANLASPVAYYVGGADLQGVGLVLGFKGSLDDFRIYSTILTSNQVLTIYSAGAQ